MSDETHRGEVYGDYDIHYWGRAAVREVERRMKRDGITKTHTEDGWTVEAYENIHGVCDGWIFGDASNGLPPQSPEEMGALLYDFLRMKVYDHYHKDDPDFAPQT